MRIAYLCYVRAFASDGVNDKITRQVSWWRAGGHDVAVFALSRSPSTVDAKPRLPARVFPFSSVGGRVRATVRAARAVRRFAPDAVYLRYDRYIPPLPPMLWPIPLAIEINADDTLEARFWGRSNWIYNEFNRRLTFPFARGLVAVTHELANAHSFSRFRKPTVVIANGADLLSESSPPGGGGGARPSAVMLAGSIGPWVGLDRAVELARRLPEVDVHLVGCRLEDVGTALPDNVRVHGLLPRSEYGRLLAEADFGIGPLAVHRKGMDEASPLKVREYLIHGLPVLISHTDTDFSGDPPWFLLRIPNTEDNVDRSTSAIRTWLAEIRGRRVPPMAIAGHIGMQAKETTRLAFLSSVAGMDRMSAASAG